MEIRIHEYVPRPVRLPQVEKESDTDEGIPEKSGNDGRPYQRLQLLDTEAVNDGAQHERPRGQRNRGHHVKGDPEPPRVCVVQIGGNAETEDESGRRGGHAGCDQQYQEFHEKRVALDFP